MSWFLVGVLLHSFFYLQVVVGDNSSSDDDDLYCPNMVYYQEQEWQPDILEPCTDDVSCNDPKKKCCTTVVVDKASGFITETYSLCTPGDSKTIYGYCPVVPFLISPTCNGEDICTSTDGCLGLDICCMNECGTRTCMAPTFFPVTKDGRCPNSPNQTGNRQGTTCNSDFNCTGQQKCCDGFCADPINNGPN